MAKKNKENTDKTPSQPMDEAEFQEKVLTSVDEIGEEVEDIKDKQGTLLENYEQLSKDTKKAMEDLTKVKNSSNDVADINTKLQRLQVQLRRESRMAFGDPIQRMLADEEVREKINLVVRNLCGIKVDGARLKALDMDSEPGSSWMMDDLAREIYDLLAEFGAWSTLGVRNVGTRTTKYPRKTARPKAVFVRKMPEGKLVHDTNKAGTRGDISVELIGVLLNVFEELLEDSEFDVAADVLDDFMQATNERWDHCAFAADGADNADEAEYTGVFNFGTAAVAATGRTTIGATKLDDWVKCLTTVAAIVLQRSARWWMHPYSLARTITVRDDNGRSIFLTSIEAPAPRSIGSILGYPVTLVHAAPSADEASAKIATFGDPRGYVVAARRGFQWKVSEEHRFAEVERSFRALSRAGFGGLDPLAFAVLTLPAE